MTKRKSAMISKKNIRFVVLSTLLFVLSFSAFIPPARADGSFSLSVQGTTNDPLLGKVINVDGQNKPIVTIVPSFSGPFMGYDKMKLEINGSFKNAWENTANATVFAPSTYGWSLCAGNDTSGQGEYTLVLYGIIDAFSTSRQVASDKVNITGTPTCTTGGSTASLSITATKVSENAKQVKVELGISNISESEFCSTNIVQLKLKPPDVSKGEFCAPGSTTIKPVTWDTTNTTKGTYKLYAVGLNQARGGNIRSTEVSVEIKGGGAVGSVGGSGGGDPGLGGGGTKSVELKPIIFDVPDSSRLKNKYGADLIVALRTIILDYLILIVSILAAIAIIISGLMYISSYGDPAKAEKAKKNLQWAIYGIVVVVLSLVLLTIVGQLLHKIK